jgi:acyl-CoA synthetase (AMP-forming)/AMP-acid ligase II
MRHPEWDAFIAESDPVAALPEVSHGDLSDLLFTSGTTGHPKGVMTCHGQNVRAFTSWATVIGLRHGDRYLVVNPFFHAFGYKAGWLACLLTGATCLPHPVFDPVQVLARIAPDRVSMLPGPPALFQRLLAHPDRGQHDLSSLRLAVTGAAVIPVELIERMRQELGFDTVITGYGLTEACGIATMCRHDDDPVTIANTSGRAIDGVEVVVVVGGKEVPRGEAGEVLVRGYNVMRGYFEDPEATATSLDADGYLHTGDIGVMDERGYLRITDRAKDMFIMGGFNCYPAEIERLMLLDPSLAQVAVIGVPDERMGEVGMAFVVPAGGASIDEADVLAGCKERMANFKVPRHLRVVDALPMNATGKVQKVKLREWV